MITCTFEDGGQGALRHVVVDTVLIKDGKVMMVKRAPKMLQGGKWGLIGGFVDRDETVAQAAAREVLEETGWEAKDVTLMQVVDNPDRPNDAGRQNVVFFFTAKATEKTGEADDESTEQKWFAFDEVPDRTAIAFDHADRIEFYKRYLAEKFPLPVIGQLKR